MVERFLFSPGCASLSPLVRIFWRAAQNELTHTHKLDWYCCILPLVPFCEFSQLGWDFSTSFLPLWTSPGERSVVHSTQLTCPNPLPTPFKFTAKQDGSNKCPVIHFTHAQTTLYGLIFYSCEVHKITFFN